ncbi:hypothetical protein [Streptomyces erythrochromogenes]|uniref:hypothetical protein n=1 Tax=Streptomyces erythrochromogenes TaxID=285574 RepID=UPI0036BEE111
MDWLDGLWEHVWGLGWKLAWALPPAVAAALVMGEISQLLATLSTAENFSYDAGVLTGWPGFWPDEHTGRADAVKAWNAWAAAVPDEVVQRTGYLRNWLLVHVTLDVLVFAPAYVCGLYVLLRCILDVRAVQEWEGVVPGSRLRISVRGISVLVSALLLADVAETVATGFLVTAEDAHITAWAVVVTWLSWGKWICLGAVVFLGLAVLVVDVLPVSLTDWLRRWQTGESLASRTWTRHRVQLIVLALLAVLIVLPGGGPLEQVPDIQRSWAHGELRLRDIAGPVLTLVALSLAMWVAGRWALLDGVGADRKGAHTPMVALILAAVVSAALLFVAWVRNEAPWSHRLGALAIPIVALAIAVFGFVVPGPDPDPRPVQQPSDREKAETIGRALTVVPIVIAGLGLVRAFARPVLLASMLDSGVAYGVVPGWFLGGLVIALVLPPFLYQALKKAEGLLGENTRVRIPGVLGWLLLVAAFGLGVGTAVVPLAAGAWLRTLGVLSLMLTTVVLLCAWFIRGAETREPYRAFRALRFRFTPIWLPVLAVLSAQSMLDNSGVYHAVRLLPAEAREARAEPAEGMKPFSAQEEFTNWYKKATACRDELNGAAGNAIPMVFVAAAGGGIRAAYWTGSAMERMTDASPCTRSYTFGLSGVSGGSLGLAAHTLTGRPGAGLKSKEAVRRLADEDALSADIAAMLYRDGTHAFHGMNHIFNRTVGDRASVFERAWEQTWRDGNGWENDLLTATRHDPVWSPILLMNGTDVASGCRVAVGTHWTTGVPIGDETLNCRKPAVAGAGGQFATATVDGASFADAANCETSGHGLRMSTAAHLSARFTYVSPSGTMYRCAGKADSRTISAIDGGYLEASGLAALLDLWSAVEPFVADHNRVEGSGSRKRPYVMPILVFLDNHYSVQAPDPDIDPLNELVAPLTGMRAAQTAALATTLQQEALVRFNGPPPGTDPSAELPSGLRTRSFLVAPRAEPQIAAPLGWVLSDMSMNSMDAQIESLATPPAERAEEHPSSRVTSGQLHDVLSMLEGPLSITPKKSSGS